MIGINVQFDIERARRELSALGKEVNKGAARSLDRVATTVRKVADQEIRKRLALKSATVKDNIKKVRPYGQASLIRDVVASGGPIPLKGYSARQTRSGVTYKIGQGKPRKVYIRSKRKGFINPGWGGGNVFVAVGPNPPGPRNAPIKKVYGPGIAQAFVAGRTKKIMLATANERWPIEFNREMAYRKGKAGL